ncbi:hypothetical protein So717_40470 [Roseobacter cerasinus]|uniref:Uncharacterized protein n=1 Tax=Roseobacter cerasinus TaxID=2602289 RepID=A0A640VXG5_9RHOB|nr:hypothetical protein [Roseobacter cerasinus]GFE52294.1 hypothetical protein So717_40470 [Roseobacter cerasinus]
MIELLFVACLSTAPTECRERSLLFTDISPTQCLMGAQPELAKWSAHHPKFDIKSWRCRTASLAEQQI